MIRALIIALLLHSGGIALAQRLEISAGAEKTAIGSSVSARFGLSQRYKVQGGVFFQTGRNRGPAEFAFQKYDFAGGYLHLPLATSDKLIFGVLVYGGLVNNEFFVVTPAFETRVRVFPGAGVLFGCGYRYGYPSAQVGLVYQFLNKQKS